MQNHSQKEKKSQSLIDFSASREFFSMIPSTFILLEIFPPLFILVGLPIIAIFTVLGLASGILAVAIAPLKMMSSGIQILRSKANDGQSVPQNLESGPQIQDKNPSLVSSQQSPKQAKKAQLSQQPTNSTPIFEIQPHKPRVSIARGLTDSERNGLKLEQPGGIYSAMISGPIRQTVQQDRQKTHSTSSIIPPHSTSHSPKKAFNTKRPPT